MKVGVLGSGIVGRVLGNAFLKEGHEVMIGTRDPLKEDVRNWQSENPGGKAGTYVESAVFGEFIVLAVGGLVAEEVLGLAGKTNIAGKIIIDATNPIAAVPPQNGVLKFFTNLDRSLMEELQAAFPDSKFVKAFNSVGNALMYKPGFDGTLPTMFICGNDSSAKEFVTLILDNFGWETADMGSVEAARAIEPLCILWCIPGLLSNQWQHAFKLLKK